MIRYLPTYLFFQVKHEKKEMILLFFFLIDFYNFQHRKNEIYMTSACLTCKYKVHVGNCTTALKKKSPVLIERMEGVFIEKKKPSDLYEMNMNKTLLFCSKINIIYIYMIF